MTTRFTREKAIVFVIMSFVYSYGHTEPFFVLMEVVSVLNDWVWLIGVTKWRTENAEILSNDIIN